MIFSSLSIYIEVLEPLPLHYLTYSFSFPSLAPEKSLTSFPIEKYISITSKVDIINKRLKLREIIFGSHDLPVSLPNVTINITDDRFTNLRSLTRIDQLTVNQSYGVDSIIYKFHPIHPNNQVIIYHQGHRGDFYHSVEQISYFLDSGYTISAVSMPLGNSPRSIITSFNQGNPINTHADLKSLPLSDGSYFSFFILPVVQVLNHIFNSDPNSTVSLIGISGGAWTCLIVGAVDERVSSSFLVAGTSPLSLRIARRDYGDIEERDPLLYDHISYFDLYMLASSPFPRRTFEYLNKYDPCCFAGNRHILYSNSLNNRLKSLQSGSFHVNF